MTESTQTAEPWDFAGWGESRRITDLGSGPTTLSRLDQPHKHTLGAWRATVYSMPMRREAGFGATRVRANAVTSGPPPTGRPTANVAVKVAVGVYVEVEDGVKVGVNVLVGVFVDVREGVNVKVGV